MGKQQISIHPGGGPMRPGAPVKKAKDVKSTVLRLWSYIREEKKGLSLVFIVVLFTTAFNTAGPYLMKIAVDNYIIKGVNLPALAKILVLMGVFYVLASLFTLLQQWIMIALSQKVIQRLRGDIFHHFQLLTVRFFDTRSTGDLMSSVTNDIDNISNTLSVSLLQILSSALSILSIGVVMVIINWKLALICLCTIPLLFLITRNISRITRSGFRDRQKYLGELNGLIEESITGHRIIKSFTKEDEILESFSETNAKLASATNKANITSGFMGPGMNMMNNLNYAVTAFAGGVMAIHGVVTVGTIAAFLNYTKQFARPLNQVAQLYNTIQSAVAGAERIFLILDEKPEFDDEENALPLDDVKGHVVFKDLHFSYVDNLPILKGINIEAKPSQTIALVGPTGAGKTTIINLLTRFYDYNRGSITIDGLELKKIRKSDLRKKLGIVLQDTFLFSGTVRENIRYGRLNATDKEIEEAAKIANAHQFIHRMPKGYDTVISEDGESLSQGQRQLISIARAVLSDPSILILDEATSSVDTLTEMEIQKGMLGLMEGRTSFVIAHRLSTIKNADKILVMHGGNIMEEGSHSELLKREGLYFNLYMNQFVE